MAYRTRVKICGLTRIDDALSAEHLGVDAVGFVFCRASSRYIAPDDAARIARQLGPFVTPVGLFLDATETEVQTALESIPRLIPQFHGRETPAACERYHRPYIKALGMAHGLPGAAELDEFESASAFLLDSHAPGELGGTGRAFDWTTTSSRLPRAVILAGGLTSHNVAAAIARVRPWAVDVSSGVEKAKGSKDPALLRHFMQAVAKADREIGNTGER